MAGAAPQSLADDLASGEEAPLWATDRAHTAVVQVMRLMPMDDRARAASVCRAWRDAAADPALFTALWLDKGSTGNLNNATLARLCARAAAALRELRLDKCSRVTAGGMLAALLAGGCACVQRLMFPTLVCPERDSHYLTAERVQELVAACPVLEYVACRVRCARPEDVAAACALLPGPLTLYVEDELETARALLQMAPNVAELEVHGLSTDAELVAALCEELGTNITLLSLRIYGNHIGTLHMDPELQDAFIWAGFVNGYDIGDAGAIALAEALHANTTLKTLKLECSSIGDAGAAALGEALRTNTTLTTLDLHGNGIGAAGATALAEALRTNTALTTLELFCNGIGDAGAAALAEALRTNTTLTSIDLDENSIGNAGAAALGDALRTNATLKTLLLINNTIGDEGATALGNALRTNAALVMLWLWSNRIGDAGAAELANSLRTNAALTSLGLCNNPISDEGAAALGDALRTNVTLEALMLTRNENFSVADEAALRETLCTNTTLRLLVTERG